MKKFLISIFSLVLVLSCCFMLACNGDNKTTGGGGYSDIPFVPSGQTQTATFELNYTSITLEKLETIQLIVSSNGNSVDGVTWESLDSQVASVENGALTGQGAGTTIITAKKGSQTAKCLVTVTDNKLIPGIVTNVENNQLNLMPGGEFVIDYQMTYNGKPVETTISAELICADGSCTFAEDKISAIKVGSAVISISATWNGFTVSQNVKVVVVHNLFASIYDFASMTLYNDTRAGNTAIRLNPSIIENDEYLQSNEYSIQSVEYDDKVIAFNEQTLTVSAVAKGSTDLKLVIKSNNTGATVESVLPVNVNLYNVDNTAVTLADTLYMNRQNYYLFMSEIYSDLDASDYEGYAINTITDITNSAAKFNVPVENGVVNVKNAVKNGLIAGERTLQIECGKYSYIVKTNVKENDATQLILGSYYTEQVDKCEYNVEIANDTDGNDVIISLIDSQGNVCEEGTAFATLFHNNKTSGYINVEGLTKFTWGNNVDLNAEGMFYLANGSYHLKLLTAEAYSMDTYVNFYSDTTLPYAKLAGSYSLEGFETIVLNENGTCIISSSGENGTYVLQKTGDLVGNITMTFKTGISGQSSISGTYSINKSGAKLDLNVGTTKTLTTEGYCKVYNDIQGYLRCLSGWQAGVYFNADGTCLMYTMHWMWNATEPSTTFGTYVIDEQNNSITITIEEMYNWQTVIDGVYDYGEGQKVQRVTLNITAVSNPIRVTRPQ